MERVALLFASIEDMLDELNLSMVGRGKSQSKKDENIK